MICGYLYLISYAWTYIVAKLSHIFPTLYDTKKFRFPEQITVLA